MSGFFVCSVGAHTKVRAKNISKIEIEIEKFLSVQAKSRRLVVALIENVGGVMVVIALPSNTYWLHGVGLDVAWP